MMPKVSRPSSTMTSSWPTGSGRRAAARATRARTARSSTSAASPIGTLIQKIARQPIGVDQRTADDRAEAEAQPDDAAPHADGAGALARFGEDVGDDRHRDGVEHRPADRLHRAERDQPAQARARRCTAASRARTPPGRSGTPGAGRAGRPWTRTASAGWRAPRCRRRSSTAGRAATRAGRGGSCCSATLTIVLSMPTISRLMQQIARISIRRRRLSSGTASTVVSRANVSL